MSNVAIRAGKAFVELFTDDTKLVRGLKQAEAKMKAWANSLNSIGSSLAMAGGAILAPMSLAVKEASDLNETMSKFGAVFGDQAAATIAWLDEYTAAVGRSKREVADGLSSFQAFFSGLGVGKDEAAGMSKELVSLAIDFGSFHNVQDPEAIQRFISALSGSGEVLSMYGVNLMSAALDQELLAKGFPTVAKGATEVQKVMGRMSIIKNSLGTQGAIGDAIKTAGGFANQLKGLKGIIADTAGELGALLIPVFQDWLVKAREVIAVVAQFVRENPELVSTVAKFAGGMLAAGLAMKTFGAIAAFIGPLLTFAFTPLGAIAIITAGVLALASAFGILGGSVAKMSNEATSLAEKNAKLRSDDEIRMQRLEQLAESQSLSNDEMDEANNLIRILENRYGALGVSVNEVTGQIEGLSEAQAKLNEAMKKQEIADVNKQVVEATNNINALKKERAEWSAGGFSYSFSKQSTVDENRERIRNTMDAELQRRKALEERLALLQKGQKPADDDISKTKAAQAGKAADVSKTIDAAQDAQEKLAKLEEERHRASLSDLDREFYDIKKQGEERKKLLESVIEGEKVRKGGARPEVMADLQAKLAAVDQQVEADSLKAERENAAKFHDEFEKGVKEAQDRKQAIQDQIDREQIELKYATQGLSEKERRDQELQKSIALLELEKSQAIRDAQANNAGDDELALIEKRFGLQRKLAEAGAATAATVDTAKTVGTFSAAALGRMGGISPVTLQKKQLQEAEATRVAMEAATKALQGLKNWLAMP